MIYLLIFQKDFTTVHLVWGVAEWSLWKAPWPPWQADYEETLKDAAEKRKVRDERDGGLMGMTQGVMCPKMAVLVERMMKDLEGWNFGGTQFADKPLLCSHVRSELFHFAAERFHVQVSNQTN